MHLYARPKFWIYMAQAAPVLGIHTDSADSLKKVYKGCYTKYWHTGEYLIV